MIRVEVVAGTSTSCGGSEQRLESGGAPGIHRWGGSISGMRKEPGMHDPGGIRLSNQKTEQPLAGTRSSGGEYA